MLNCSYTKNTQYIVVKYEVFKCNELFRVLFLFKYNSFLIIIASAVSLSMYLKFKRLPQICVLLLLLESFLINFEFVFYLLSGRYELI